MRSSFGAAPVDVDDDTSDRFEIHRLHDVDVDDGLHAFMGSWAGEESSSFGFFYATDDDLHRTAWIERYFSTLEFEEDTTAGTGMRITSKLRGEEVASQECGLCVPGYGSLSVMEVEAARALVPRHRGASIGPHEVWRRDYAVNGRPTRAFLAANETAVSVFVPQSEPESRERAGRTSNRSELNSGRTKQTPPDTVAGMFFEKVEAIEWK